MMSDRKNTVYVVHCVDTEGPLYESTAATFDRIKDIAGIEIAATRENLVKMQRGELPLNGKEKLARVLLDPHLLEYLDTWDKLDRMLQDALSPEFRLRFQDSQGNGWRYNWFILDHVGYVENPRRRDIGYHNIFDHYRELLAHYDAVSMDEIHWHFHPMSTYRQAHVCATSFLRSPHLWETLSRRIIDRRWFPSCFRAGFHSERPDSHWFLEQWIPFDFSNQAIKAEEVDMAQADMVDGRFGDWRRAPADWSPYHPSHDDYQTPGNCNRIIFRCLNIGTRMRLIDQHQVDMAFARAQQGKPTVLSFTDHDFRDLRSDVRQIHEMLLSSSKRFPDVQWLHAGANQAATEVLSLAPSPAIELNVSFRQNRGSLVMRVETNIDSFGPQPFLAIKTFDQTYLSDNFDMEIPRRVWTYTFDAQSVVPLSVEKIGVAVNSRNGTTAVAVVEDVRAIVDSKPALSQDVQCRPAR
jgi:hypothetical protein